MSSVSIHYQTPFTHKPKPAKIKKLVRAVFQTEHILFKSVDIIFCNVDFLLKLNQDFLKHDTYTDIITFNYSDDKIVGELYISFERLMENANSLNTDIDEEILRVIIHGCLHLCGYKDKAKKDKIKMTQLEDRYLVSK